MAVPGDLGKGESRKTRGESTCNDRSLVSLSGWSVGMNTGSVYTHFQARVFIGHQLQYTSQGPCHYAITPRTWMNPSVRCADHHRLIPAKSAHDGHPMHADAHQRARLGANVFASHSTQNPGVSQKGAQCVHGKPVASNSGLLRLNNGLLWDIVDYHSGPWLSS